MKTGNLGNSENEKIKKRLSVLEEIQDMSMMGFQVVTGTKHNFQSIYFKYITFQGNEAAVITSVCV